MPATPPNDATLRALLPADRDAATTARWVAEHRSLIPALFTLARTADDLTLFETLAETCAVVHAALGPDADPRQRAWVLAEQANALRRLAGGDAARLQQAIDLFDAALAALTPATDPQAHALALARRSAALSTLGELRRDEAMLRQALAGFEAALAEPTLADLGWDNGSARFNHGNALRRMGEVTGEASWLRAAAEAYGQAYDRTAAPIDWASAQRQQSRALVLLGRARHDSDAVAAAVQAAEAAPTVPTAEDQPEDHAATMRLLDMDRSADGDVPVALNPLLAELERLQNDPPAAHDAAALRRQVALCEQALALVTRETDSMLWASLQGNRANALTNLGNLTGDAAVLRAAEQACRAARGERSVRLIGVAASPLRARGHRRR